MHLRRWDIKMGKSEYRNSWKDGIGMPPPRWISGYVIEWKDQIGRIDYNKKPLIRELKVVAQKDGLNNKDIQQYQFTAILQKTVGSQDAHVNMTGSLAVNMGTKSPSDIRTSWHQLSGPKKIVRNMKPSQRKEVISYGLQQMALYIHKELGPTEPAPITFSPDGEMEIPSFLRRK